MTNNSTGARINRRSVLRMAGAAVAASAIPMSPSFAAKKPYTVALLPKFTGHPYYVACLKGAQAAAKELGITLDYNGPVEPNVQAQSDMIDRWVRRGVDCIAVAALDPDALVPAMQRATQAGIKCITWDADTRPESRLYYLSAVDSTQYGASWIDSFVKVSGKTEGELLIVTSNLTAPNQNGWIAAAKKYASEKYPGLKFPAVLPGDEDVEKSRVVALNYLQANPQTVGVLTATGSATPGAMEAIKQLGLVGKVNVAGGGVPSMLRPYFKDGSLKEVLLWNPEDLGYGTMYVANAAIEGTVTAGGVEGGRLGKMKVSASDGVIILSDPFHITADNIDKLTF